MHRHTVLGISYRTWLITLCRSVVASFGSEEWRNSNRTCKNATFFYSDSRNRLFIYYLLIIRSFSSGLFWGCCTWIATIFDYRFCSFQELTRVLLIFPDSIENAINWPFSSVWDREISTNSNSAGCERLETRNLGWGWKWSFCGMAWDRNCWSSLLMERKGFS